MKPRVAAHRSLESSCAARHHAAEGAAVFPPGLLAACAPESDLDLALRVAQGADMGRPSLLMARAVKRGGMVESTHVGGRCVAMMRGVLEV